MWESEVGEPRGVCHRKIGYELSKADGTKTGRELPRSALRCVQTRYTSGENRRDAHAS